MSTSCATIILLFGLLQIQKTFNVRKNLHVSIINKMQRTTSQLFQKVSNFSEILNYVSFHLRKNISQRYFRWFAKTAFHKGAVYKTTTHRNLQSIHSFNNGEKSCEPRLNSTQSDFHVKLILRTNKDITSIRSSKYIIIEVFIFYTALMANIKTNHIKQGLNR